MKKCGLAVILMMLLTACTNNNQGVDTGIESPTPPSTNENH